MVVVLLLVTALFAFVGCARPMLPYRPDPQPAGARVSADYQVLVDRIRIEIDTDGRRLEQAWIMKPDGSSVAAEALESPPVVVGPSPNISFGIGGGTFGSRGGVGTGVSVGVPVGGGTRAEGNTVVWFPAEPAGPPPWTLYVKLAGIAPVSFPVGGPPRP